MSKSNVGNKLKCLTIIILGVSILFASCSKPEEKAEVAAPSEEVKTIFAVSTTTAVKGELKDYLEFGGDVCAKTSVDVTPDAAGRVVSVNVSVGDYVNKDAVIAMVDASRPGMTYSANPVRAPISGTITTVNVVEGSMVSQQLSVARISKTNVLEICMNVPERYISKIQKNQMAYLRFDAYPGELFPAEITEISPVLDTSSRTMGVKLSLIQNDSRIKAGMFARVKLITDTHKNIVKIPESAVVTRYGETFIFTVNNEGKAHKQIVQVGIRVDDKVEILSGLNPDEEVIIRGQSLLEEGSLINIVAKVEPLSVLEIIK